jgi:hypothetical protein
MEYLPISFVPILKIVDINIRMAISNNITVELKIMNGKFPYPKNASYTRKTRLNTSR